ncbi:MAG: phosphoribosylaminoimidazolesuccinocarboxamide synthase [Alphaproteobacteria bacterium]|nr:phosphoribosylaminoimidazolesuccinocarboxamide synthase [Alphaproteobacteria bacterium]
MARNRKIYEGKAKILFEGPDPGTIIQHFKDDVTAFNGEKRTAVAGKGILNNRISAHLMTQLEIMGIPTHFIRQINMREQLVRRMEIIPVQLVVRNVVAGSLVTRLGLKEGMILSRPIVEYYYKDDKLGNPMVSEDHIVSLGWADPLELEEMVQMAWRINDFLSGLFTGIGLRLVDFRLEFGRLWDEDGNLYVLLADEISPDSCRIWDLKSKERLDKDRFRFDLGDLIEGYQKVAEKLGLVPEGFIRGGNVNEQLAASLEEIENELSRERRTRGIGKQKPRFS